MKRLSTLHIVALLAVVLPFAALAVEMPTPVSPANGSKGAVRKPTLTVTCPADVEELEFQLFNTNIAGDEPIAAIYTSARSWTAPGNSYVPTLMAAELPVGEYWWTCRAANDLGWSDFFEPRWSFEIESPVGMDVGTPVPLSPPSGGKGSNQRAKLVVEKPVGAGMLNFRVYTPFSSDPVAEIYIDKESWNAPDGSMVNEVGTEGFAPGVYEWTCRAASDLGWSDFFEPRWTFVIDAPEVGGVDIGTPMPLSPPSGGKGSNKQAKLVVEKPGDAEMLNFRVYTPFSSDPVAEIYIDKESWNAPDGSMINEIGTAGFAPGVYEWTCRAGNNLGWGDFFEPRWSFEIAPETDDAVLRTPPAAPSLLSPPLGTKLAGTSITLVVGAPAVTKFYHFQVKHFDGGDPVYETLTRDYSWLVPLMLPIEPDVYKWSCRVFDGELWGPFAEPWWTFEVGKPLGGEMADGQVLMQPVRAGAFPNPVRPGRATSVRFTLDRAARVSASIYNSAGALVKTLATDRQSPAGSCEFVWDGTDETGGKVGTGTYLCRLSSDDGAEGSVNVVKIVRSR